jgi:hypothetical protein
MTELQKKALKQVSETLDSFDTYPVYRMLTAIMKENNIEDTLRSKILEECQKYFSNESHKVLTAKDWVNTLIKDNE